MFSDAYNQTCDCSKPSCRHCACPSAFLLPPASPSEASPLLSTLPSFLSALLLLHTAHHFACTTPHSDACHDPAHFAANLQTSHVSKPHVACARLDTHNVYMPCGRAMCLSAVSQHPCGVQQCTPRIVLPSSSTTAATSRLCMLAATSAVLCCQTAAVR